MDLMKGVEVENLQTRCVIVFIKTMFFIVILHQVSSAFPKSASGAGDINFDNNINFCGITMKITPTTISTITTKQGGPCGTKLARQLSVSSDSRYLRSSWDIFMVDLFFSFPTFANVVNSC